MCSRTPAASPLCHPSQSDLACQTSVSVTEPLQNVPSGAVSMQRPTQGMDMTLHAMRFRRVMTSFAIGGAAVSAAISAPAFAQGVAEGAAAPASGTQGAADVVVVQGSRPLAESQAAALEIQRKSDSLVSVLSADAIGNLPDQNAAFAVGRVPGVGLERDQGQARYVNLRGAPNYWTTLSFDGLSVVSPEGRSTRFDNIPSAIAKQIVVTKALTPNLPGDTVAGNVDIITRSAFDYQGRSVTGKLGLGYVTLGGGEEADASLVASDTFLDGRLGILVQGSYYRRNMVTDNWETDPYLSNLDGSGLNYTREHENKLYRLTRENQSLSARADYQFDDNNSVFWSNFWTNYTDEELRSNYIFRLDQGTAPSGVTGSYATVASGNTALLGTSYGARINFGANSLESEEDTYSSTLGGAHAFDGWDISWRANYVVTSDGRDAPALPAWQSPSTYTSRPTVTYNFTNYQDHTIRLFRTTGLSNARTLGAPVYSVEDFPLDFVSITRRVGADETQAATFKLDASHDFSLFSTPITFSAGVFYTDRQKKSKENSWVATRAQLVAAGVAVPEITATGPTPAFDSLFLNKEFLGKLFVPYSFRYQSKTALEAFALDLQKRGIATPALAANLNNFWKVGEEITAAYAMGRIEFDWGSIVGGARIERFRNNGLSLGSLNGVSQLITSSSEDTLVYPSANINWDISQEMKVRLGLTTSASRPDFDQLRPNVTINDALDTISGGNPAATPEKQKGVDLYFEWYMEPEGFFSAGVFYKDISDFLYTSTRTFGSNALDSGGIDRSGYVYTGIANGGDGWLQGVEVTYAKTAQGIVDAMKLPDWLGGFGVQATGTWVVSEVDANGRTVKLPGTSAAVLNLQATYEKYNLSVRLAYQYRSAWIQSLGSGVNASNGDTYWDDDQEIDLSVNYRLNDNLEWFFEGSNLGNQSAIRYIAAPVFPIEHETFGPRYMTGVRFNF